MALWQSNMDTPPLTKKQLQQQQHCNSSSSIVVNHQQQHPSPMSKRAHQHQITYLSPGLVVSLCRRDLILALVQAGEKALLYKFLPFLLLNDFFSFFRLPASGD